MASEMLTLARTRLHDGVAKELSRYLFDYGNLEVRYLDATTSPEALALFLKYNQLSFADAASIALMKRIGANEIASFDSDFDRVPGIQRLH